MFNFSANYGISTFRQNSFIKQSQKSHEKNELENTYYFPTISNFGKFFVSFCWSKWDKVIVNAESTWAMQAFWRRHHILSCIASFISFIA